MQAYNPCVLLFLTVFCLSRILQFLQGLLDKSLTHLRFLVATNVSVWVSSFLDKLTIDILKGM